MPIEGLVKFLPRKQDKNYLAIKLFDSDCLFLLLFLFRKGQIRSFHCKLKAKIAKLVPGLNCKEPRLNIYNSRRKCVCLRFKFSHITSEEEAAAGFYVVAR